MEEAVAPAYGRLLSLTPPETSHGPGIIAFPPSSYANS